MTALVLLACADVVNAQGRVFEIESVQPRVVPRGTIVDVIIRGTRLREPQEIVFYRPGIRVVSIGPVTDLLNDQAKPIKYNLAHGGRINEQFTCRFAIAPDCPLGEHPLQIRRDTSLTVVSAIHVTPFPVVDENEADFNANDTRETAVGVTGQATVRGSIKQQNVPDVDLYKVSVKAGQRLAVEADMVQISDWHFAASEYDLALRILDEKGRVLAANDDSALHVQDPIVAVRAPRTGDLYVEVKQSTYTALSGAQIALGGVPYSLHIGSYRRPLAAYPPGGPVGKALAVKFLGDPLGEFEETLVAPSEPGNFTYFGGAPSPLTLRASPYPNVLEDTKSPATRVDQLPVALNGIIAEPGEVDAFRLSVKKGSRWRVRTFAAALGSPLDPVVRLRPIDKAGNAGPSELEADDATLTDRDIMGHYPRSGGGMKDVLDPSLIWTAKADGEYLLEIGDTAGGGSSTAVYRVEIEPASDGIACVQFAHGQQVSQGGNTGLGIRLEQMQGNTYNGEIEIVAHGLPAGAKFVCRPVPKATTMPLLEWPAIIETSPSVAFGSSLITLEARSVDPTRPIRSDFQWKGRFILQVGGDAFHLIHLERSALAVTNPLPFSIELPPLTAALVRNGELAVPVKIKREKGFAEPLTLDFLWLPIGVGKEAAVTVPEGQSEAVLRISAENNAKLGVWPLAVTASADTDDKRGPLRCSSRFVDLAVAEPFVILATQSESLRRGERKRYVWKVEAKHAFDGTATVKLLGLPKGVTQLGSLPTITKETKEVSFEIEATDEALLGPVTGVACEVALHVGGQEIHQRSGKATLRIDPKL
jgi:hypothetical protein